MSSRRISELDSILTEGQLVDFGLEVANIVCTVDLKRQFDLLALSEDLINTEYHPETSPFLLYRPDIDGEATIMIPTNGNISIVGASDIAQVTNAFTQLKEKLSNLGIEVQCGTEEIIVQNLVLTGNFEREFDLSVIAVTIGLERTEYEPEQFPGLIFRSDQAVVLLFKSGTFVITGATSFEEAVDRLTSWPRS